MRTSSSGEAQASLTEGIYLVVCKDGQSVVFPSFLVRLPLELDGELYYDVDAFPKSEPTPQPTTAPPKPDTPSDLPQTGWDPLPAICLAAVGAMLLVLGGIGLVRSRKERRDD